MASDDESVEQTVPGEEVDVRGVQSQYLRCPSPSFSLTSESRFSAISGSDAASIFMEPIHLSSAVAAKKIISEELPPRGVRTESVPESMLESAEQLMVEDLYNRVRDMIDDRSPYNTPCVLDIQRAMVQDRLEAPVNPVDEVWPNIFIGEKSVAVNKARLKRMGITHILNAAHGTGVYTSQSFYAGMNIQYMGIEVDDFPDADISVHFRPTAEFLDEALLTHKGKVLVVSMMGVSRSAVLAASYLMIFQNMSIMEALTSIRKKRPVNPNEGFLKQLRQFNESLMEERDDDDDTLSQCSVVDARARAQIFGEDDEDTDKEEEEQSMVEAKAQSIMMEEEEDGESVMSSIASSAAAAALRNGEPRPEPDAGDELALDDDDGDEDLDRMIGEWQRRNEKYQSEEWWEEQLEGGEPPRDPELESVTSEDIRAVKQRVRRRGRPASDAASTSSRSSSYSDLWKQRLKEIEEQAAARYREKEEDEEEPSIEDEVSSIVSDSSSMYNFCQRNKEKMTPLERWRIKRIQFGWNKKDREDGEGSTAGDGEEEAKAPQEVNLTAYQSWKLRQQKRLGEENTDEILELSRGENAAAVRRRQRREEILERSKKTLEESQSQCGWEAESGVSGATVPLSAFWAGVNDDTASTISGKSSVISSVSQPRSSASALPPILPVPPVQGAGGEPMVNLASIQNWIATVVSETIKQKQSELSLPSRVGSEFSFSGAPSVLSGRGLDDEKVSLLSGASGASSNVSGFSGLRSTVGSEFSSMKKKKITTTSVPLFSLFQDQVNLGKLDAIDKEMKSDMRDKMAAYEKKKILEDNKRSTLYKKKKTKEDEDEEEERKKKEEEFMAETAKKAKPKRSFGLSGHLNLNPALEKEKETSVDDWLKSVRPPPGKTSEPSDDPYDDLDASASEFEFSSRSRASFAEEEDDDEEPYGLRGERDYSFRGFARSRAGRSGEESQDYGDSSSDAATRRPDEDEDISAFIAQTRQRIKARVAAEIADDEVLTAWRTQQEAKAQSRNES